MMGEPYRVGDPETQYIETEALLSALRWFDGVEGAMEALEIQLTRMTIREKKNLKEACSCLESRLDDALADTQESGK